MNENIKQKLTVKIIQLNHAIEKNKIALADLNLFCSKSIRQFQEQRELKTRILMIQRVLNAAVKMLDNNKLELWMIDDKQIKEATKRRKSKNEKK